GAIACAIAVRAPHARVIATDASSDALAVAESNARALGVAARVELRQGDLFAPIGERVDVVCANLPYLRADDLASLVGERTSRARSASSRAGLAVKEGADARGLDARGPGEEHERTGEAGEFARAQAQVGPPAHS